MTRKTRTPAQAAAAVQAAANGYRDQEKAKQAARANKGDPLPGEIDSQYGYARLIHVYGGQLRYVPEWKWWLAWDGRRWAHDTTGQAARWMKSIARRVTADALAGRDDQAVSRARHAESAPAIAGALTLAGTEPEIVATPDHLDADPFLLNCANGTLDLRTMQLMPHDPADLITKITGAAYTPGADGPEWDRFLARVQPDLEMRCYLARLAGHGLEGRASEPRMRSSRDGLAKFAQRSARSTASATNSPGRSRRLRASDRR